MRNRIARLISAIAAVVLVSACQGPPPPPPGLVAPAAEDLDGAAVDAGPIAPPAGERFLGLRITVENPPPELLDPKGAGVVTVRRPGDAAPRRLIFANGVLSVHALPPGPWRIMTIAGYACGPLGLPVPPGEGPIALGDITLALPEVDPALSDDAADLAAEGRLTGGSTLTPDDLALFAGLFGEDGSVVAPRPLLQDGARRCRRWPRAASRPDIDPTVRRLTIGEQVQIGILAAAFGALTGGAAAVGSFVFVSGTAGGFLFLAF
ncbi:MAG: hypothetical protein AAF416_00700 [Pseudomonadota bacterium]